MHSTKNPERVLLIRNDKLGDFMLSWPSYAMLKINLPNCTTFALVPEYTREIAEACPWIDKVLIDPGKSAGWSGAIKISRLIRQHRINAIITLFSTTRIALAILFSGAHYRIAPATKITQIFYRNKVKQHRSKSIKPEYEYNLDLVRNYLNNKTDSIIEPQPPYFSFQEKEIQRLKSDFMRKHNIDAAHKLIIIHPGSGGSASNLSHQQYCELAQRITKSGNSHVILSAGPDEASSIIEFSSLLSDTPHTLLISTDGLTVFAKHIAFADLFISGSTGPLHLAGALNIHTAAFYPRRRSATALRWKTINEDSRQLTFSPPENSGEEEMSAINIDHAARKISRYFL